MVTMLVSTCLLFFSAIAYKNSPDLIVNIAQQKISFIQKGTAIKQYSISTSGYGIDDQRDNKTPLGKHRIHKKIGAGAPIGTIFKGSINTKRIALIHKKPISPAEQSDFILTRILQLDGLENRNCRSFHRGIWVHGTPHEGNIGTPCSHGCIRMNNHDICQLFDLVQEGMILDIVSQ